MIETLYECHGTLYCETCKDLKMELLELLQELQEAEEENLDSDEDSSSSWYMVPCSEKMNICIRDEPIIGMQVPEERTFVG